MEDGIQSHSEPLRNRPLLSASTDCSDTVYIRGFSSAETDDSVMTILRRIAPPIEVDLSSRVSKGQVWAKYSSLDVAWGTISALHQATINGSVLSVKYELGVDVAGKRIVDRSSHNTVIRSIGVRKDGVSRQSTIKSLKRPLQSTTVEMCTARQHNSAPCKCTHCGNNGKSGKRSASQIASSASEAVSYTSNSLCVGDTEYPFPSGVYLTRIIELAGTINMQVSYSGVHMHSSMYNCTSDVTVASATDGQQCTSDPLLDLLLDSKSLGNKYAKEISEAMAMVDAVQRAISLLPPSYRQLVSRTSTVHSAQPKEVNNMDSVASAANTTSASAPTTVSCGVGDIVRVYVLGDGKQPLCAAATCLHLPGHFEYYSIDPLMCAPYSCEVLVQQTITDACAATDSASVDVKYTDTGDRQPRTGKQQTIVPNPYFGTYAHRFFPVAMMSQDFAVPSAHCALPGDFSADTSNTSGKQPPRCVFSIIVSCHSHAPLQEFWDRVSGPKVAVAMPCCAGYAELFEAPVCGEESAKVLLKPVIDFNDYEVYSPKRNVKIYFEP